MPLNSLTVVNARWGVIWISPKTGKWVEKHFDDDLPKAIEFQNKLVQAGRKATVRCLNVGFAPPKRITAYEYTETEVRLVRGKRKKVKVTMTMNLMEQYNSEGVWWCPYCIKCRKFEQQTSGLRILMYCPACGISSKDGNVKRYNPYAINYEVRRTRERSTSGRRRRIRRGA